MQVIFLGKFSRDLDEILESSLKREVMSAIHAMEQATKLSDIPNIKKMKGYKNAYRMRIRDYRIGFYFENGILELARFLHRSKIYQAFP